MAQNAKYIILVVTRSHNIIKSRYLVNKNEKIGITKSQIIIFLIKIKGIYFLNVH